MKYYFRDLLTLLISLFILSGCENPSKVGLDVDPGDQIQGALIDTLKIHAITVKEDSVLTRGSTQFPLGYLKDPVIGESYSSIQFALQNVSAGDSRIPTNATIDSAVMVINYGKDFFGDSLSSSTKLEVRQLASPYEIGKNYPSNATWTVSEELYGSRTLNRYAYRDSVMINTIVSGRDTTVKAGPHLRIPMDVQKIKSLFDGNLDSATFAGHDFYHSQVKGFQIRVNKEEQTGIGSLVHLNINLEENGLVVYYKTPDTSSQKIKFYPASANNAAAAIQRTYTADVQAQLNNPTGSFETVYAQGPAGLRVKLSLPDLSSLKDKQLVVNKAELVIYTDEEATGNAFTRQAGRLTLYRQDIAGQRVPVPDGDTRANVRDPRSFGLAFGGNYDASKKRYVFALTSYIQDLLLGKIGSDVFYIAPAANVESLIVPYLPTVNAGSRAVLGSNTNPQYKMKLNIYYTKAE